MVSYAEEMCLLQGREMLLALDGISRGKCMGRCDSIPLSIKIGFYTCSSALRWDANFLECNCSTNRRDSKRTSDNIDNEKCVWSWISIEIYLIFYIKFSWNIGLFYLRWLLHFSVIAVYLINEIFYQYMLSSYLFPFYVYINLSQD